MRSQRLTAWLFAAIAMACAPSGPAVAGRARTSTSTATSGRSSPSRATSATAPTPTSARPTCGSIPATGLFRSADGSTVVVPGKPDESELLLRITADDAETRMPPPKAGKPLTPAQVGPGPPMDRAGGRLEGALVLHPGRPAGRVPTAAGADAIDRFLRARMTADGPRAVPRGRPPDPDPPPLPRPDRPASHPRGGRRLRPRRPPRRLRAAGRPAAGLAPLRRADGRLLARPGPVRRHPGLSQRQPRRHLDVPRLRDPLVQRQQAVRPVHDRAARRRPAAVGRPTRPASPRATTGCSRPPRRAGPSPRSTSPSTPRTGCATSRRSGWA